MGGSSKVGSIIQKCLSPEEVRTALKKAVKTTEQKIKKASEVGKKAVETILHGTKQQQTVFLKKIAKECNKKINEKEKTVCKPPDNILPVGNICTTLGSRKHKCCEKKIIEYNETNLNSPFRSEVSFSKNKNGEPGEPFDSKVTKNARGEANEKYWEYINKIRKEDEKLSLEDARAKAREEKVWCNAFFNAGGGAFIADVLIVEPADVNPIKKENIKESFDFKFNCSKKGTMLKKQIVNYKKFTNTKVEMIHVDGRKCP